MVHPNAQALGIEPRAAKDCARDDTRAIFELRDLTITYNGAIAVRGVTWSIRPRQVSALIGPSGAGKSSLLLALARLTDLVPGCRTSGSILFEGDEVLDPMLDALAHRRRVGMIFQQPCPFPLSIRENITLALEERGIRDRARLEEITRSALEEVGLWAEVCDRLDRRATVLSGGQQQRLCLARALALEPEVLLLDEPCSALDPISAGSIETLLRRLRARMTIVIVTHDLTSARRIADEAALLWNDGPGGRLIECGPCKRLFDAPCSPLTRAYVSRASR